MGQVLHGSATTTEAIRRTIQHSQESLRVLARRESGLDAALQAAAENATTPARAGASVAHELRQG
jgi:hypothetical protein